MSFGPLILWVSGSVDSMAVSWYTLEVGNLPTVPVSWRSQWGRRGGLQVCPTGSPGAASSLLVGYPGKKECALTCTKMLSCVHLPRAGEIWWWGWGGHESWGKAWEKKDPTVFLNLDKLKVSATQRFNPRQGQEDRKDVTRGLAFNSQGSLRVNHLTEFTWKWLNLGSYSWNTWLYIK